MAKTKSLLEEIAEADAHAAQAGRFLALGSVTNSSRAYDVGDIDLIVPEFTDDRMYTHRVDLEIYEKLAEATGKPIDLFFTTHDDGFFNLAGWYRPGGRWQFRMAFCGCDFFLSLKPMTFQQIVDEVARTQGSRVVHPKNDPDTRWRKRSSSRQRQV
jgi:hypothetical protein